MRAIQQGNVPRSIFGFAGDETDGSRVMAQVKNPHGCDDLPSLGYKIETTQLHVVRGGGDCFCSSRPTWWRPRSPT
jgi:hypothetical protein